MCIAQGGGGLLTLAPTHPPQKNFGPLYGMGKINIDLVLQETADLSPWKIILFKHSVVM